MNKIMLPTELADTIVKRARLPTSDGKTVLPVSVETVRTLIAQAITEDRETETNFNAIVDKVMENYGGDGTIKSIRNISLLALQHAQSAGARFQKEGPNEADYAEAVQSAIEAFSTTLKDKGLWK
jgi:predicted SpoU family rRNA methylase